MTSLYVINLKRRPKQYETFLKNNSGLPINIIRFEAIDGLQENNKQSKSMGKDPVHKQTKHGRFGCFLSHLEVLKMIAEQNNPDQWSFISEDDTVISPELFEIWDEVIEQTKTYNIDILVLSRTYAKKDKLLYPLVKGFNIVLVNDEFYGAHFYMVTKKGAQKILGMKEMNPYESIPYDVALGIAGKREQCIYSLIKYDPSNHDYSGKMYSRHLLAYAGLSGTMGSSTEEYYENIKEMFNENKNIAIPLFVFLTILIIGIVVLICFLIR